MPKDEVPSRVQQVFTAQEVDRNSSSGDDADPEKQGGYARSHKKTIIILVLWFIGILFVIGHHIYYHELNGHDASLQSFKIKIGTAFAFIIRGLLSIATSMSLIQQIWYTLRTQEYSFGAVDKMFAIGHNPLGFFSGEVLQRAKLVCVLAICLWLIPLSTIAPVSTLTVVSEDRVWAPYNCTVPAINLNESGQIQSFSDKGRNELFVLHQSIGVYNGNSFISKRIASSVANTGQYIQPTFTDSLYKENITYTLDLHAPATRCQEVDWRSKDAPWYTKNPNGTIYNGRTVFNANTTRNIFEDILWITWIYQTEKSRTTDPETALPLLPDILGDIIPNYEKEFTFKALRCYNYEALYKLKISTLNKAVDVALREPLTYLQRYNYTFDNTDPINNNVRQHDALSAMGLFAGITSILSGSAYYFGGAASTGYIGDTDFLYTSLADPYLHKATYSNETVYGPPIDLGSKIETWSQNVVLSLFSRPDLVIYQPSIANFCTPFGSINIYHYNAWVLWVSYGAGILVSGIVIMMGMIAAKKNGATMDAHFSSVASATRDEHLNSLLREKQGKHNLQNYKLKIHDDGRFGVMNTPS